MNNQEIKQKLEDITNRFVLSDDWHYINLAIEAFNLGVTLSAENAMVSNSQTNQAAEGWDVKQGEIWNSKDVEFKVWKDSILKLLIK